MKQRLLVGLLLGLGLFGVQVWQDWPAAELEMIFCDVGQGDAILLQHGFTQILVDGGPSDQVLVCLEEYVPFWDKKIELVVASHADADHITGLVGVYQRYEVSLSLVPMALKDTSIAMAYQKQVFQAANTINSVKWPIFGQQIGFTRGSQGLNESLMASIGQFTPSFSTSRDRYPPVEIEILAPQVGQWEGCAGFEHTAETALSDIEAALTACTREELDINSLSTVLLVRYGEVKLLLTGDIDANTELSLVEGGVVKKVHILKVAHHGSKTSSSQVFLETLQPEQLVLQLGKNNRYDHPSPEVMNRLMQFDVPIWRTDRDGTVRLVTDGVRIRRKE